MPPSETLRRICEAYTALGLDLSGPNEFRVMRDTVNHEVAHALWSDLSVKRRIAETFPAHSRLAGTVANILEDAYIDARRVREWPGLRRPRSFFVRSQMDAAADISDRDTAPALMLGLHQIAISGRANGVEDADPEVVSFLAWVRRYIAAVRDEDDTEARAMLTHHVVETLIDHLPPRPDIDDVLDEIESIVDDGNSRGGKPFEFDDEDIDDLRGDHELPDAPDDDGDGDGDHGRDVSELLAGHDPGDVKVTN